MTAGPVTTHRSAGCELRDAVAKLTNPSGDKGIANYVPLDPPLDPDSPTILNQSGGVTIAALRHSAQHEQVQSLTDLLARRTGLAWTESRGREGAHAAAAAVADILGWDENDIARQTREYLGYIDHTLRRPD